MRLYNIQIDRKDPILLSQEQWDALKYAMSLHEDVGYRDGDTNTERVRITELGTRL